MICSALLWQALQETGKKGKKPRGSKERGAPLLAGELLNYIGFICGNPSLSNWHQRTTTTLRQSASLLVQRQRKGTKAETRMRRGIKAKAKGRPKCNEMCQF